MSSKKRDIGELEQFTQKGETRNRQLLKSVATLQQQIEKGATEEVTELRSALTVARDRLVEQHELLTQLTAQPLIYATVLRVNASSVPTTFAKGSKVRVLPEADYHAGETGTVVEEPDSDGVVIVKFADGDTESYHARQTKPIALEIPDNPKAMPRDFTDGVNVKIVGNDENGYNTHKNKVGTVVYMNGRWRRVRIKNVSEDPRYWVGSDILIEPVAEFAGSAVVLHEDKQLQVELPREHEVKPGDTVKLSMQTLQIVEVGTPVEAGDISIVRRSVDELISEVEYNGNVRVVLNGKLSSKPEVGDRVLLDSAAMVITRNLGKEDERFSFSAETNVTWDDIGGLAEAKKQMVEAIELPFRYPDIYKHYGKKPIKGVLLYGPPGCGKTMLGKAAATALAKLHNGQSVSSGFIYVKGPEILDRFVGVAEATIRQIFQRSRKHKQTSGYPAVIFIDEADAILGKRGMGISSDIERTIVPQFLAEMDGLEETGAIVLLATNRADILDPAVTRDGRVDRKVKITRPDLNGARDIFQLYLKNVPLFNGYERDELADLAALEMFSDKRVFYSVQLNGNHKGQTKSFTLGNLSSGAMVAGVVDQATSIALHRDIANGKPQGMSKDDLVTAVECVFRQNFDLNHNDELADFVHDFRDDVVGIQKLRQSFGAAAN